MHPITVDLTVSSDDESVCSSYSELALKNHPRKPVEIIDLTEKSIVSLDIGQHNCGVMVVRSGTAIMWQLLSICSSPVTAHQAAESVVEKVDSIIFNCDLLPTNTIVFIEMQLHYIPGHTNGATCRNNNVIAACFQTAWRCRKFETKTVSPLSVKMKFGLPSGRDKKKAAVKAVINMLEDTSASQIDVPPAIVTEFLKNDKKDDLADCFLQALWYQ